MAETFTFEEAQQPASPKGGTFSFEEAQPQAPRKAKSVPRGTSDSLLDRGLDSAGAVYNIARGAVMGPVSDVAGLAAIPLHSAGAINTPPIDVKRKVQQAGAYEPKTAEGRAIQEYNPLALIGKGVEKVAGGVGNLVSGKDPGPLRAALGYGAKGAIEQAPMLAGSLGKGAAEGASTAMRGGAERLMHSALKPGVKYAKKTDEAIDTLLSEGINVSPGGLRKLHGMIDDTNSRISQLIAQSPAKIDKGRVAARLHDTLTEFEKQVDPHADLATIQKAWDNFMSHPLLPGEEMSAKSAQQLKQGTYKRLQGKYGQLQDADAEAQKALARGLKEEIAKAIPDVAPLNAHDSKLLSALPMLERRVIVSANKNLVGLGVLSLKPENMLAFMADRSELFKSIIARMLNRGSQLSRERANVFPALAATAQGAENDQIGRPPLRIDITGGNRP